jgi:hypothetical protein
MGLKSNQDSVCIGGCSVLEWGSVAGCDKQRYKTSGIFFLNKVRLWKFKGGFHSTETEF